MLSSRDSLQIPPLSHKEARKVPSLSSFNSEIPPPESSPPASANAASSMNRFVYGPELGDREKVFDQLFSACMLCAVCFELRKLSERTNR